MKKLLIVLFAIIALFTFTACGNKESEESNTDSNKSSQKEKKKDKEKQEEKDEEKESKKDDNSNNTNNDIDDEIVEVDNEENKPINNEVIKVEKIINCDGCVFSYFSDEKAIGSTLSQSEYTNDINTLKTTGGKQRHNFFGFVLADGKISKAYSCILKDNKIYCIQGSTNGAYHSSNVAILNQIFGAGQCKTLSDGHNYWCTDGSYNGNSKTSGYTSLHYETSCTIYGSDSKPGKLICN